MTIFKTMSNTGFLIIGLLVFTRSTFAQVTTQENAQTTQATITQSTQTSSETQSTAANAGAQSTQANTGTQSTQTNTGTQSTAANAGAQSTAASTGAQSTASSSSTQTAATSSSTQAATTPSATQTTGTSTETTAASADTQTTAAAERASVPCPDGQYNDITDTVTFILDERECQITVYLSKPPKGKKIQKAKKAKKEKEPKKAKKGKEPKKAKKEKNPKGKSAEQVEPIEQGERLIEKSVSIGPIPGRDVDMCADVQVSKYSKDVYSIQAGNCVMYVKKPKKGKNGSSVPMIRTETNPPV
ncbi:mucin-2-like [Ruditapes philippinarum]|uniref:mucin-2-like n=1 Tax=Ruditapes philippinarum TaxID=129788 RepID=UPI00295B698D|nr:mucin-2-like [Ruditapes philippinarum]